MLQQQQSPHPPAETPPLDADLATIHAWIGEWMCVRRGVEELLDEAVGTAVGHDTGPFLTLLEEIDSSIRLLNHRVGWLTHQISHKRSS